MEPAPFVVLGGGPAGLAAAHLLALRGRPVLLLEAGARVGGLARTFEFRGFRFDLGGHRFFTKNREVEELWRSLLPDDLLTRPRLSRIFYRGRLFHYPLRPLNALAGLGLLRSARVFGSFAWRRLAPKRPEKSFEDWVSNRFGPRLYRLFFQTYTEKVWGIPCAELSADWAAQRIRNLNLGRAILDALGLGRKGQVASLIDRFQYPRLGPGQMYEALAAQALAAGARLRLSARAAGLRHDGARVTAVLLESGGRREEIPAAAVVSTVPLSELAQAFDPPLPEEVRTAAFGLRYRSLIAVNLLIRASRLLPDTWIYLHAPEVRAARAQFYKNWSPEMVPGAEWSSVGMEYFVNEGDELWSAPDEELLRIARQDFAELKLSSAPPELEGMVARYAKAYPIYDPGYQERVAAVRRGLARFPNLACAGRYGQFRYNNMDHSILTGRLAARRMLGEDLDPWAVNEEAEYLEEARQDQATREARGDA